MRVTSGKSRVGESRPPGSVREKPNGRATQPRPGGRNRRKAAIAPRQRARTLPGQQGEAAIAVEVLNYMIGPASQSRFASLRHLGPRRHPDRHVHKSAIVHQPDGAIRSPLTWPKTLPQKRTARRTRNRGWWP